MAVTHLSALDVGYADAAKHSHDRRDVAIAATLQASGGKSVFKNSLWTSSMEERGTVTVTGAKLFLRRWATIWAFTGGGSAIAGVRSIATGGSSTISTKRIAANSVLLLSHSVGLGATAPRIMHWEMARTAGTSFKVGLKTSLGTGVTGKIYWLIIN